MPDIDHETSINDCILAVVVTPESKDRVAAAGAPLFFARDDKEQQKLALYLSRVLNALAHDLENGVLIIVRH